MAGDVQHGTRHSPWGSDPTAPGPWLYVGTETASAWSSGTAYAAGNEVDHYDMVWICLAANTNIEPIGNAAWPTYWSYLGSDLLNGFVNNGDGSAGTDELTRTRLLPGSNPLADETQVSLEVQINLTGGVDKSIMFSLPPGYWESSNNTKQTIPAVNDNGEFTCVTFVPRNDATGITDVYAGRV